MDKGAGWVLWLVRLFLERGFGMSHLQELIGQAADAAESDGVECGGEFGGPVHQWVRRNVSYRPETEFYVVFLLSCELADRQARREGFKDQADRAVCLAAEKLGIG